VEHAERIKCQTFLTRLNEKLGVTAGTFSLPTEAQWEYACRAGTTTKYSFGNDERLLGDYAWYEDNSKDEPGGFRQIHPVGQKKPNAWGLYDMHGNVSEWCADRWDSDYYSKSPNSDPTGPEPGDSSTTKYVLRGGDYRRAPSFLTSAMRECQESGPGADFTGFRVAVTLEEGLQASQRVIKEVEKPRPFGWLGGDPSVNFETLDFSNIDYSVGPQGQKVYTVQEFANTKLIQKYRGKDGNLYEHGKYVFFVDDVQHPIEEKNYVYGRLHGKAIYYKDGRVPWQEETYYNGELRHSLMWEDASKGRKMREYDSLGGEQHGWEYDYLNGQLESKSRYEHGKCVESHGMDAESVIPNN